MSDRATLWSVTINNPTQDDEDNIQSARQKWKVHGQLEKGEGGTPHYQLAIVTPQIRFSAMKKHFPRAHIEIGRDKTALLKYVNKEDTRIASLPSSELYPSQLKVFDEFGIWIGKHTKGAYLTYDGQQLLDCFDKFAGHQIEEGYITEQICINPQTRSAIKLYGQSIIIRSIRRQTDRQDKENHFDDMSVITDITNDETIQEEDDHSETSSCSTDTTDSL